MLDKYIPEGEEYKSPDSTSYRELEEAKYERDQGIKETEENAVDEENNLRKELMTKKTYRQLDFHVDISSIPENGISIIKKLKDKYQNDDSLEGTLFNNPQLQNLLAKIVSKYAKERDFVKSRYSKKKEKSDNSDEETTKEEVESREDFALRESTYQKFENWLVSEDGIRVLINEINNHIDKEGNLIENYPIDEKDLKLKLEKAWLVNLRFNYNIENNIVDNDEKKKLNDLGKLIQDSVNQAVKNHLIKNGNVFDAKMVDELNSVVFGGENGNFIRNLKDNSVYKDEFKALLREYIKNYSKLVLKKKDDKAIDVNLDTGSKQLDLQLKCYLFIYGKTFIPEVFNDNGKGLYESGLLETLKLILSEDYKSLEEKIKNVKLLEREKQDEENRRKREAQRRQEAAKRNRERNNNFSSNSEEEKQNNTTQNPSDINEQSGTQIAAEYVNLNDFKVNNNLSEIADSDLLKQKAFGIAWERFSKNNDLIKDILTPKDMRNLYNIETNNINMESRKEFVSTDIMKGRSQEEINKIYNILSSFSDEYINSLKHLTSKVNKQEGLVNDKIKNHALGAVIDNVKLIFSNIVEKWKGDSKFEGFKFDDSEPVKRKGNDIIISGTFGGKDIKIRYDLVSGGLFMNSYIKQFLNPSKFVIGNNSEIDYQIGELDSFDTILRKNYSTPDISLNDNSYLQNKGNIPNKNSNTVNVQNNIGAQPNYSQRQLSAKSAINRDKNEIVSLKQKYSEMLHANIDMISKKIIDNTRRQSTKNSAVINFMKTFNIIIDDQEDKGLEFNDGSNLFDLLQIIENTGNLRTENIQSLEYFNNEFMPTIMKYSCLRWGDNNLYGPQKNEENRYYFDATFDDRNKNEHMSLIRENANDFSQNLQKFKPGGTRNYDSDYQLGFAQMIIENLTNDVSKPNWKLDITKMNDFIKHLENDNREA